MSPISSARKAGTTTRSGGPVDANTVIAAGVQYARTTDGGATWSYPWSGAAPHVDVHDLRYDASGMLWIANDGGIWTSTDNASSASNRNANLVTRQYYAMAMDRVNRNRILAGTQDNVRPRAATKAGRPGAASAAATGFSASSIRTRRRGLLHVSVRGTAALQDRGERLPLTAPAAGGSPE